MKMIEVSVFMAVAMFIVAVVYFVLSDPVLFMLDWFGQNGAPDRNVSTIKTLFLAAFVVLGGSILVLGLIYATRKEYDQYYRY